MNKIHMNSPDAGLLLAWYDRHHRDLPWRISPAMRAGGKLADPYHVWLSEIMLQQTNVTTVKPYFFDFLTRWPNVNDLAGASNEDVMKAWAGLGYYARARNLKKCAQIIARDHAGQFPDSEAELKKLPGIGDYTAAAISAIAFSNRAVVMDGNIERVISRLHAIEEPLPGAKAKLKHWVDHLTPDDRSGDFAQAMMDLGATICTPKRPACGPCPFSSCCKAKLFDDPERFPLKAPKKTRPIRLGAAFVALNEKSEIYLQKRPEKGLLGGMTEVPTTQWVVDRDGMGNDQDHAPFVAEWRNMGLISHIFTHFELRLTIYLARVAGREPDHGWWEPTENLKAQALPTLMKKAIAKGLQASGQ